VVRATARITRPSELDHFPDLTLRVGYGSPTERPRGVSTREASMSFAESVRSCFSNYVTWNGRAGRAEYWWFALFAFLFYLVGAVITVVAHSAIPVVLFALVIILPSIAVAVRRLHDTGRSGWWYWISLIPLVGGITLLVFMCSGSDGPNSYGSGPDGAGIGGAVTA
jgi:uncharacterized membrane protein YhaH (DUF805 family)